MKRNSVAAVMARALRKALLPAALLGIGCSLAVPGLLTDTAHAADTARTAFMASDSTGLSSFVTDGTRGGTTKIAGLADGLWMRAMPGKVLIAYEVSDGEFGYRAVDTSGVLGPRLPLDGATLWRPVGTVGKALIVTDAKTYETDGTVAGTKAVTYQGLNAPTDALFAINGTTYFFFGTAGSKTVPYGIYKKSATGLTRVVTLASGLRAALQTPIVIGTTVYFAGETSAQGRELWAWTVGSAAARLVKDASSGQSDGISTNRCDYLTGEQARMRKLGNRILFETDADPVMELWSSDGTTAGTRRIATYPYESGCEPSSLAGEPTIDYPGWFARPADIFNQAFRLWKTDGTPEGTAAVTLRHQGPELLLSSRSGFAVVGDSVLFFAGRAVNEGTASEPDMTVTDLGLYKRDALGQITRLARGVDGMALTPNGSRIDYRGIRTGSGEVELWTIDVAKGTALQVKDILPGTDGSGPKSSYPVWLTPLKP